MTGQVIGAVASLLEDMMTIVEHIESGYTGTISVLPHRDPLLLIDRVCSVSETEVVSEMCLAAEAPVSLGIFQAIQLFLVSI